MTTYTDFVEFFTRLRQDVDQAHRDRQDFNRRTRAHVQQLAAHVRNDLAQFAAHFRAAGRAFRGGG
jgi:hypothetical protein